MIAEWMIYSTVVAMLLAAVAGMLERILRAHGRQARHLWLAAIALTLLLTASVAWRARPAAADASAAPGLAAVEIEPAPQIVAAVSQQGFPSQGSRMVPPDQSLLSRARRSLESVSSGGWHPLDNAAVRALNLPLAITWIAASVLVLGLIAASAIRIRRRRASWSGSSVGATPILVTDGLGPAVVGMLNAAIAVPRWVLDLDPAQQRLIIEHERQHLLARDPLLILSAFLLVALVPFNPAAWLMLRRLRGSTEMDCDRRVLRAHPTPGAYAALLVDVGARSLPREAMGHALADPASDLERRVRHILGGARSLAVMGSGVRVAISALLVFAACAAPRPRIHTEPAATTADTAQVSGAIIPETASTVVLAEVPLVPRPAPATMVFEIPPQGPVPYVVPVPSPVAIGAPNVMPPATATAIPAPNAAATATAPATVPYGISVGPAAAVALPYGTPVSSSAVQQDSLTYIMGRVMDSTGTRPVSFVSVTISERMMGASSDSRGFYAIPNVPPGTYSIRASRLGYTAETRDGVVVGRTPVNVDFKLASTALQLNQAIANAPPGDTLGRGGRGAGAILGGRGGRGGAAVAGGAPGRGTGRGAPSGGARGGAAATSISGVFGGGATFGTNIGAIFGTNTGATAAASLARAAMTSAPSVTARAGGAAVGTDSIASLVATLYPELFRDDVKTDSTLVAVALDTLGVVLHKNLFTVSPSAPLNLELLVQRFPSLEKRRAVAAGWFSGLVNIPGRPSKSLSIIFAVYTPE